MEHRQLHLTECRLHLAVAVSARVRAAGGASLFA